jgi:nitrate/nitrite-specific signal transduction histidine kinase
VEGLQKELNKKDAKVEYKLSHRPMGIFQIRNTANEKVFVDSSINVPGKMNRHKFQLNAGVHASKSLQTDWNELGETAFEFEVLEDVTPKEDPNYDYAVDLDFLEDLWLEKLEPYGDKGYNERKKTREERLRMIAANRKI